MHGPVMLILATGLIPRPAGAHSDAPLAPHDFWTAWTLDPWIVVPLAVAAASYGRAVAKVWGRAGPGRGVRRDQVMAFSTGLFFVAVALVSPLDPWGEVLFSAHMVQHMLLILVGAPLIVLGAPSLVLAGLPRPLRRPLVRVGTRPWFLRLARVSKRPMPEAFAHMAVLAVWHVPALFNAALVHDGIHILMHASFLVSGLLFWWAVLVATWVHPGIWALRVAAVLVVMVGTGLLSALITWTQFILYEAYGDAPLAWGLTPLEDQQLGGILMWVPGGVVYFIAALALFACLLRAAERAAPFLPAPISADGDPVVRKTPDARTQED